MIVMHDNMTNISEEMFLYSLTHSYSSQHFTFIHLSARAPLLS